MKLFLDTNVLISVLNKEYPVFSYSSRILSLKDQTRFSIYTSPLCLAIAFYFSEKKSGNSQALKKIGLLARNLLFTNMGQKAVEATCQNKKIHDFEDGLQYYSAIESACNCIITEDRTGFYFSEIETATSREFLEKYIL